jgi:KaiC/GvpD/RAD55 family RecA-like ATPase
MKEEYLKKINELYNEISNVQSLHQNPYSLEYLVKQILDLIDQLNEIDAGENYSMIHSALYHTLDKEVYYADYSYKRVLKKNAAKVRQREYEKDLNNAIDQIRLDIYSLLKN